MNIRELSLTDLDILETNISAKYREAFNKIMEGDKKFIDVQHTLETKLSAIRNEINRRVDNFINE